MPVHRLLMEHRYWRVGRVLFRRQGLFGPFLDRQIDRFPVNPKRKDLASHIGELKKSTADVKYVTAQVRARTIQDAEERIREAIAVARLFQRVVVPAWSLDQQTFGLAMDIGSALDTHWMTGWANHYPGIGWRRHGVLGEWTFTRRMLTQIAADDRFRFLSAALLKQPAMRSEIERRLVLSLRFLNRATVMVPAPIRVAMLGLVIEVLLADNRSGDGAHRIARRASYLTCGEPTDRHGIGARPACYLLAMASSDEMKAEALKRSLAAGLNTRCSWYDRIRTVYRSRNKVMHEGLEEFPSLRPATYESWVDDVVLGLTEWTVRTGKDRRVELDAEIRTLVSAGVT